MTQADSANGFEDFISRLEETLPRMASPGELIKAIPEIFTSERTFYRMKKKGQLPPGFFTPAHTFYFKDDVIEWFRDQYQKDLET